MPDVWQDRSEKAIAAFVLNENGRKVFYVLIIEQLWIFFDIDPDKEMVGPVRGQITEIIQVLPACVAPLGAVANNHVLFLCDAGSKCRLQ